MRALVVSAGLGARLAPITYQIPKAFLPVCGEPLIFRTIDLLKQHGFDKQICNVHHLAEHFETIFDRSFHVYHEEDLSGTAGAIRSARHFLERDNDTFVVIMGDVLTDMDISEMVQQHKRSGCIMSIASTQVNDTCDYGIVHFDHQGRLTDFHEKPKYTDTPSRWANTGIYCFEPEIFNWIPPQHRHKFFDIALGLIPCLLHAGVPINIYQTNRFWADLGTHHNYRQALFACLDGAIALRNVAGEAYSWGYMGDHTWMSPGAFVQGKAFIGDHCRIGHALLKGHVVIENNCIIEDNVVLENTVVLQGSVIRNGSRLRNTNVEIQSEIVPPTSKASLELNDREEGFLDTVLNFVAKIFS